MSMQYRISLQYLCVLSCLHYFKAHGERNYHIFYQLCASSHLPEFKAFKLGMRVSVIPAVTYQ